MIGKQHIAYLLSIISLSSVAQGRLWNRGTIHLDVGTEARVHGNIILDEPVTGDGYLVFAGTNPAFAQGDKLQTDNFRIESTSSLILNNDFKIIQHADLISGVVDLNTYDVYFSQPASISGGNNSSYFQTSGNGKIIIPVNNVTATIPLGINSYYIQAGISQQGLPDTFSLKLWPALTDNGLPGGNAITSHVGAWAVHFQESVYGFNDITLSLQWPDNSLTSSFFEPHSVMIFHNGTNYIPLSPCGEDLSLVNPNTLQVSGLQFVGLYGVGDSLYLPPQPQANITMGGPTQFCFGDSVGLQASTATSYLWNTGATTQSIYVSASGSYQVTITDINSCQSVSPPITITVYQPDSMYTTETACDSFFWNATGQFYYANGQYTAALTNQNGCDSIITLDLLIQPSITYSQTFNICPGASVTVGNNTYASPGTYYDVFTASNGCDSMVTTTLIWLDCSGISQESSHDIQIFPNPTQDVIYISNANNADLQIFNLQGQIIIQYPLNLNNANSYHMVDIKFLPPGVYILRINELSFRVVKINH
ncbi:MAG: T9SS type A sorting domain-containing protein [Flavobacteriales bacterium]|nr:T9SS type A sorting domain-containing protein [Flavobacteriales bacterium]